MKAAAAVTAPDGQTSVRTYDVPECAEDAGVLRVAASGVCGTDVRMVRESALRRPTVLGHHIVGRLERLGATAARRWGVAAGDLVGVQEYLPCRTCRWCRSGEFRFCNRTDLRRSGRRFGTVPVDEAPALWGGNAEFMHLPPEALVHRLPPSMRVARSVWLLPLANAFDWTIEAGVLRPGGSVVVVGPGQHGLTCVVAAREAGAGTVVLIGTPNDEDRLALGAKLGADHALGLDADGLVEGVLERLDGARADLVVNTSGAGPPLLPLLVKLAGKGGRVVEGGLTRGHVALDMDAITSRAIGLVGARGRSLAAVSRAIASLDTDGAPHPLDEVPTWEVGLEQVDAVLRPDAAVTGPRPAHIVVLPSADGEGRRPRTHP